MGQLNCYKIVNSFKNLISNLWGNEKPLCKLLSTEKDYYIYDSGTNKLLKCDAEECQLLKYLLEFRIENGITKFMEQYGISKFEKAAAGIDDAMRKENILKILEFENFGLYPSEDEVFEKIMNNLDMVHLEVTNKCNLNCKYCVYNENSYVERRKHGNLLMNFQTAMAAVDYLVAHSSKTERTAIGFYGGEPLLNIPTIQKIANYAKSLIKNKEITFHLTTNATLITEEMAKYFYKENFSILVSLDGPQHIHDLWRTDHCGKESFDRTMNGVGNILRAYKNDQKKLGFSVVYAPPYSEDKLSEIEAFFFKSGLELENPRITITYPVSGSIPAEYILKYRLYVSNERSMSKWASDRYLSNYPNDLEENPLAKKIVEKELARLMKRPLFDEPLNKIHLNGCCIPASRKLFVTVSGVFRLCERVGDAPEIGNTKDGIDIDTIKRVYLSEYPNNSIKKCSRCWIARLCDACYAQVFSNFNFDFKKKEEICFNKRISYENQLVFLCALLERDEKGLEYLNSYVLS